MIDTHGRTATNFRISVIDRCNLRCSYCIQSDEGITWLKKDKLLTFPEILRITQLVAELGVDQLRITGGEPLVRPGVCDLISKLKMINGINRISMTTNGVLLSRYLSDLETAGLSSLNVSLDTLSKTKFKKITSKNNFEKVIDSIAQARKTSIRVKVNTVAIKGFNDDEIIDFVDFAVRNDLTLRFIEFMPFAGNAWNSSNVISAQEIRKIVRTRYELLPEPLDHPSQTSRIYRLDGTSGKIGFIASVTESFCKWCNRLRLTADGNLRTCLHSFNEVPLRESLRNGVSNTALKQKIVGAVRLKQKEHVNFLDPDFLPLEDDREMIRIGG
ncbi:MAG: GTP 3',8-cyclase MoaA [Candidatus Heimdallarchaeota archaeon]